MLKGPDDKDLKKVWLRVIGDEDLKESFAAARIASSEIRRNLRDSSTIDFKEKIQPLREATFKECLDIIFASRSQNLGSEAIANTERPELVKLEEVSIDADAPTLEEQEKLDIENTKVELEYQTALEDYIKQRQKEITSEWENRPLEELREQAELEASAIIAVGVFYETLEQEKCWRCVYEDEACKVRGFDSLEEFKNQHSFIKNQIIDAYKLLEVGPDEIKNSRKADLGE